MNFEKLRFEAARLAMELELKFPKAIKVPKGRCAFYMFELGRHEWSFYKDYEEPNTTDLWWSYGEDYEEGSIDVGIRVPDVWRKVNGSWNIVYGKPCYW